MIARLERGFLVGRERTWEGKSRRGWLGWEAGNKDGVGVWRADR